MSVTRRCDNCEFWAPRQSDKKGDCLAHPPAVVEGGASFWPRTWPDEVCGEFKDNSKLRPLGLMRKP